MRRRAHFVALVGDEQNRLFAEHERGGAGEEAYRHHRRAGGDEPRLVDD